MEAYVRHLFVMDSHITVQVLDPKPAAGLPGFLDVKVHASAGNQSQDFQFLVSKDGSKILQGTVYDVNNTRSRPSWTRSKRSSPPASGRPAPPW